MTDAKTSPKAVHDATKQGQIERFLNDEKLSLTMREQIREFVSTFSRGRKNKSGQAIILSPSTRESYTRNLHKLGLVLQKDDFKKATKDDLKKYLDGLDDKISRHEKSISAGVWARTTIKIFYRWLIDGKIERKDKSPPIVDWIVIGVGMDNKIEKADLLTPDEAERLVNATLNKRDAALLSLILDTGARVGEVLNLRWEDVKDLETDRPHIFIQITKSRKDGQIMPRKVGLIECVQHLRMWKQNHPFYDKPKFSKSFVFCPITGERTNADFRFLTHSKVSIMLHATARRAGITKRVWLHGLRHYAVTRSVSAGASSQLMNIRYGWIPRSPMINNYAHPDFSDADNEERKSRGMPISEAQDGGRMVNCPRCSLPNKLEKGNCVACGADLDRMQYEAGLHKEDKRDEMIAAMQKNIAELRGAFAGKYKEKMQKEMYKGMMKKKAKP